MKPTFPSRAMAMTDRLRALDTRRVVFGSRQHAYRFHPPLSLAQVAAFEQTHQVVLPSPYRSFLTDLGNGGAGPYYGILPLALTAPHLLDTFPSTQPFTLPDDDAKAWNSPIPGALKIAECGCGVYILLVVRGDAAGQVWWDARYEGGIEPIIGPDGSPMAFDVWWLQDMESHLERFEHIAALMQAATPHEDIHHLLEPGMLQLTVDETMLSLMDQDPSAHPQVEANKPWGRACGLVEEHYGHWLRHSRSRE